MTGAAARSRGSAPPWRSPDEMEEVLLDERLVLGALLQGIDTGACPTRIQSPWIAALLANLRDRLRRGLPVDAAELLQGLPEAGREQAAEQIFAALDTAGEWPKTLRERAGEAARRIGRRAAQRARERVAELAGDRAASLDDVGHALREARSLEEGAPSLDAEQREVLELDARFSDERTSIGFAFDCEPPPRSWLVKDLLPADESGLIVARGGTGKGHFQLSLALSLALGQEFGPFHVPKPRGVVLISHEEDRNEIHRRLRAALVALFPDDWRELRDAVAGRVRFVDLRGLTGVHLGRDLRERIARSCEQVGDAGLAIVDPLGRFMPEAIEMNSQAGAAFVVNELDALRDLAGVTALASYHVSKAALRADAELRPGASSGSLQLEDLSRLVLNLKVLTAKEAAEYALDARHRYVEAAVVKSNYTPPLDSPFVFRRVAGGALVSVSARRKDEGDEATVLKALLKIGTWATREQIDAAAQELAEVGLGRLARARERLVTAGKLVSHELREGRRWKLVFAPAENARPTTWRSPPQTLEDLVDG